MDERGVGTKGDVVQEQPFARSTDVDPPLVAAERRERGDRVGAVEAEVAREVVPCPERDADERQIALDPDLGDSRQRPVAARDAEDVCARFTRERRWIVV